MLLIAALSMPRHFSLIFSLDFISITFHFRY